MYAIGVGGPSNREFWAQNQPANQPTLWRGGISPGLSLLASSAVTRRKSREINLHDQVVSLLIIILSIISIIITIIIPIVSSGS
jgi:hypothetical protein